MIAHGFPAALIERCSRAAVDDDPVVMGMMTLDELGETIIVVLSESGHPELVAALTNVHQDIVNWIDLEYRLPEAQRALDEIAAALAKAGAQ